MAEGDEEPATGTEPPEKTRPALTQDLVVRVQTWAEQKGIKTRGKKFEDLLAMMLDDLTRRTGPAGREPTDAELKDLDRRVAAKRKFALGLQEDRSIQDMMDQLGYDPKKHGSMADFLTSLKPTLEFLFQMQLLERFAGGGQRRGDGIDPETEARLRAVEADSQVKKNKEAMAEVLAQYDGQMRPYLQAIDQRLQALENREPASPPPLREVQPPAAPAPPQSPYKLGAAALRELEAERKELVDALKSAGMEPGKAETAGDDFRDRLKAKAAARGILPWLDLEETAEKDFRAHYAERHGFPPPAGPPPPNAPPGNPGTGQMKADLTQPVITREGAVIIPPGWTNEQVAAWYQDVLAQQQAAAAAATPPPPPAPQADQAPAAAPAAGVNASTSSQPLTPPGPPKKNDYAAA